MLLVAASFLGPFGDATRRFAGPLRIGIAALLALMLLVIVVAQHAPRMAAALHRRNHMHRTQELLASIGEGLGAARSVPGMAARFVLSIGPVVAPALGYGLALRALGIPGGLLGGAVVLGAIALGQTAVGIPAGLGIYYFVTSWVARSLGASPEQAAAYALLTHLGTIAAQVGVGAISVWRRKIRWAIRGGDRSGEERAPPRPRGGGRRPRTAAGVKEKGTRRTGSLFSTHQFVSAQERSRTSMTLRPLDPESSVSTSSTTWAAGTGFL